MMRPRVLLVGNFASSWGAAPGVCEGLATHLESRGWRVLTTSRTRPRLRRLSEMLQLAWSCRYEYDVAVVDVYSGMAFVWAEAVVRLLLALRKPYILWLHGGGLPEFAERWGSRLERLAEGSKAVVAQSEYLASVLPQHRALVRFICNPIDISLYPFRMRQRPEPKLVWLRSFHEIYNPALAVEVIGLLKPEFPDVTLTMIGPDRRDGSLARTQALARRLALQQQVVFEPAVPKQDVPARLDAADIFLNTTNTDNTPVSMEEAMACGLCIVSTDVGGIPFLAREGVDALLVPPGDRDAMAGAVRRVLVQPGLAPRLSSAARHRAEGMDWPRAIEKWERLLSCAAGGKVLGTGQH